MAYMAGKRTIVLGLDSAGGCVAAEIYCSVSGQGWLPSEPVWVFRLLRCSVVLCACLGLDPCCHDSKVDEVFIYDK